MIPLAEDFFTESIGVRLDCSLSDEYMIVQRLSVYSVSFNSFHKGLSWLPLYSISWDLRRLLDLYRSLYILILSVETRQLNKSITGRVKKSCPIQPSTHWSVWKKKIENKSSIRKRRKRKGGEASRSVKHIAPSISLISQYLEMREKVVSERETRRDEDHGPNIFLFCPSLTQSSGW